MKAPKNKTIDLTLSEGREYLDRCLRVEQPAALSDVLDRTICGDSFAVLPLFLVWVQWSWRILLLGAEVAFVAQNYETGLFKNDVDVQSPGLRRLRQLTIIGIIFGNIDDGKGATARSEIAQKLHMPPAVLNAELKLLIESGLICGTADGKVLPGVAVDRTRISDCLKAIDCHGSGEVPPELAAAAAPIAFELKKLADAAIASPGNRLLRELRPAAEKPTEEA